MSDKVFQLRGDELYKRHKGNQVKNLPPLSIVATDIKTAENAGSILRVADAVGAKEVIFLTTANENNEKFTEKKLKRVSRGTSEVISWRFSNVDDFVKSLDAGTSLVGVEITNTSENIFKAKMPPSGYMVVGSERYGVTNKLLERCNKVVHIPMFGEKSSMNVACALSVAACEWRHQQQEMDIS